MNTWPGLQATSESWGMAYMGEPLLPLVPLEPLVPVRPPLPLLPPLFALPPVPPLPLLPDAPPFEPPAPPPLLPLAPAAPPVALSVLASETSLLASLPGLPATEFGSKSGSSCDAQEAGPRMIEAAAMTRAITASLLLELVFIAHLTEVRGAVS